MLTETHTECRFILTLCYEELCEKDKTNVKFLQKHVHGLTLGNENDLNKDMLDVIVKKFYDAYKTDNKSVLAYKGGSIEKDLLAKLNIPSVNLELFGCPKAKNIFPEMVWLESCGEHNLLKDKRNTHEHCPKVEVEAYLYWLTKNCK